MGRKMKGITSRDCRQFAFFWTLGHLLVFVLITIPFHIMGMNFPSLDDTVIHFIESGAMFIAFAFLQRSLIRRYLHVDTRHWVLWTWIGFIAGYACYSLFTAVAERPVPAWLQLRFGGKPSEFAALLYAAYYSLRGFFLFGFPMLFQWFALPKTFSFRWLWLLTAFMTGPINYMVIENEGILFSLVRVIEGLMGVERIEILRFIAMLDLLTPIVIPSIVLAWLATRADKRTYRES